MRYFNRLLCLAVSLFIGTSVAAEPLAWDCSIGYRKVNGWITTRYLVNYDPAKSEASVVDGVIQHFKKGFIPAEVKKDDGEVLSLGWIVRVSGNSGSGTIRYGASINQKSGAVTMSSIPLGYDNGESGRGTCARTRGPIVLN